MERFRKKIWSVLGYGGIISFLIIFILTIYIGIKEIPSTFTILTIENHSMQEGSVVEILLGGREDTAVVTNGQASFHLYEEDYDCTDVIFNGLTGGKDEYQVYISSRNHVIKKFIATEQNGDRVQTEDQTVNLILGSKNISIFRNACSNDWWLKAEILIPLWGVFGAFVAGRILWKKSKKLFIKTSVAIGILLVFAVILIEAPKTIDEVNLEIGKERVTGLLSDQEKISQTFCYSAEIKGITVNFGTYGKTPEGNYYMDVIDRENDQLLFTVKIDGEKIVDNEWHPIIFTQTLQADHEYMISFYSEKENADQIALWASTGNDYLDGELIDEHAGVGGDLTFSFWVEGPNILLILCCIGGFVLFGLIALLSTRIKSNKKILFIYILTFVFCMGKMLFYYRYMDLGSFDEMAHISYLAYVEEEGSGIPDFEEMELLVPYGVNTDDPDMAYTIGLDQTEGVFDGKMSPTVNYLGHPPLYYWLLSLTNAVHMEDDHVYVELDVLRYFNMGLGILIIILYFYIGYTRIKKVPILHLAYALLSTSLPLFCYTLVTINNDVLTYLTVGIFILGALRFIEGKRNSLTYILIALGITATLLTKMTAGAMVVLTAVIYLLIECIREKSVKCICNKYMLASLIFYIPALLYYGFVFLKYHTVQPSLAGLVSKETFQRYTMVYVDVAQREQLGFWECVQSFFRTFNYQWQAGVPWQAGNAPAGFLIPSILLFSILFMFGVRSKDKEKTFYGAFSASILVTIFIQFTRAFKEFQFTTGHMASQSRYYVCAMVVVALMLVKWAERVFESDRTRVITIGCEKRQFAINVRKLVSGIIGLYLILLTYNTFVFYLMNQSIY